MLSPEYLEFVLNCFVDGHHYEVPKDAGYYFTEIVFDNRHLCDLKVTSGLIDVSDAFDMDFFAGIDAQFPLGSFPTELAIANTGSEELVVFSRILFSKMPVARVELAMKRKAKFEPDQFSVDSGTACYFDMDAIDELDEDDDLVDEIEKRLEASYAHTRTWYVHEGSHNNIAFFTSGLGDGSYKSYIAYDADNNICQFITDFGIFLDE